jgi:hypothetical protein
MSKDSWNQQYPPFQSRPNPKDWPAWFSIPPSDMRDFWSRCPFPQRPLRILELGAGDGSRIMCSLNNDSRLNMSTTHVVCVDYSPRAVAWGVDLWSRTRQCEPVEHFSEHLLSPSQPRWTMSFREEDAVALPADIMNDKCDVLVDWMFLHGLGESDVAKYAAQLEKLKPAIILLKCFSKEGSTMYKLPRTVEDVEKRQWSEPELRDLFGPEYAPAFEPNPCKEDPRPLHPDGPIAAKREYCFIRRIR